MMGGGGGRSLVRIGGRGEGGGGGVYLCRAVSTIVLRNGRLQPAVVLRPAAADRRGRGGHAQVLHLL